MSNPPPPPTIGTDGGTVTETSGASVIVPAGVLSTETTIRIAMDSTGAPVLPQELIGRGNTYVVTPHGGSFPQPVEVRIPAPAVTLAANQQLKLAKAQPNGSWTVLLDSAVIDGSLIGYVGSFSYFRSVIVTYPTTLESISAWQVTGSALDCGSQPCRPALHDTVTATYSVTTNNGQRPTGCEAGTLVVHGQMRNQLRDTLDVFGLPPASLPMAGGSTTVTLDLQNVFAGIQGNARFGFIPQLRCGSTSYVSDESLLKWVEWRDRPSYPSMNVVSVPAQIDVVPGQLATVTAILQGGAASPAYSVFIAPTVNDRAVIDWYRSDGPADPYRTVARSYQNEADPLPFSTGTPWQYWGVRHSFVANTTDQGARIWMLACYTPRAGFAAQPCATTWSTRINVLQQGAAPAISAAPRSVLVRTGQTANLSVTATGLPAPTLQWQTRPANSTGAWTNVTTGSGATTANYTTPALALPDNGVQYRVVATNSLASVESAMATISVSDVDVAPSITTQPASLSVAAGSDAVFAVDARGTEALSYQWHRNGVDIIGANSAVLRLAGVTLLNAASYSVTVRNVAGDVDSQAAVLTVTPAAPVSVPPTIVTQPAAVTVNAGNTATFAVGIDGTGPFTFQWRRNGENIPGASGAVLVLPAVTTNSAGNYSVVIANAASAGVTSNSAVLTVNANGAAVAPSIVTQPSTLILPLGGSGVMAVAAVGSGPLSYQWRDDGVPIPGATSAVLRFDAIDAGAPGRYSVEIGNSLGSVTSNEVELLLLGAPNILQHPGAATAFENDTATFSVMTQGSNVRYQWLRNGAPIGGGTEATYVTPPLTLADSGAVYSVVVYNGAGVTLSSSAVLTVQPLVLPSVTQQPVDQSVQAPAAATFSVAVSGAPAPTLRWQVSTDLGNSWSDIPGATSANYTTPATITAHNGWRYRAIATNPLGSATSGSATLAVTSPPVARAWGALLQLSDGAGQVFDPQLAVEPVSGAAIAVWTQFDNANFRYNVWAARFARAAGWSPAQEIDTQNGFVNAPHVAIDAAGNALAVWTQDNGAGNDVWARRYSAGAGAWEAAGTIDGDALSVTQGSARVVMDSTGRGLAIWRVSAAAPLDEQYLRAAGYAGGWQTVAHVATGAFGFSDAEIAANASGGAVAVWSSLSSTAPLVSDVLAAQCVVSTASCGAPAPLENGSAGGWDVDASVAINANGVAMAVWRRYESATSTFSLRASRLQAGSWTVAPEFIDALDASVDLFPRVSVDAIGNAIAVWVQPLSTGPGAPIAPFANRYDTASGWGTAQRLEPQFRADDFFPAQRPQVAFAPNGDAVAVWESGGGIISSAPFLGGSLQSMLDIGNGASGVSRTPQVSFDGAGSGISIFVQDSGASSTPSLFVSRFE